jgi:hypothetical protein
MRELIMLAKVARRILKEVVKVCKRGARQKMYKEPIEASEAVKARLLEMLAASRNAFVKMISSEERHMLIYGRSPDGSPNCRFKTAEEGEVVVRQGDEGHAMFMVVEGCLSVVVSLGHGPNSKKEVEVLSPGQVFGEYGAILGTIRNASCVVKSTTCDLAEITSNALHALLESRPSLRRDLQKKVNLITHPEET